LKDKIALITGGSRGIGRAVAETLAQEGVSVVITARTQQELDQTAEEIRTNNGRVLALAADVTDYDQLLQLKQTVHEQLGKLDIAVINAGVIEPVNPAWKCDAKSWQKNIDINLAGAFLATHIALNDMVEKGSGTIVFISSGAASHPVAGWSAYCAAKAGVDHLNRTLAHELNEANLDIKSYSVYPGIVSTSMQETIRSKTSEEFPSVERFRTYYKNNMLRPPQDPANLVLWLCRKNPPHLNGRVVSIDEESIRAQMANDLAIEKPQGRS
jgi:NAD(P)-dependent dehydrogenase (short-subunit alcohol dehydrogenase family)